VLDEFSAIDRGDEEGRLMARRASAVVHRAMKSALQDWPVDLTQIGRRGVVLAFLVARRLFRGIVGWPRSLDLAGIGGLRQRIGICRVRLRSRIGIGRVLGVGRRSVLRRRLAVVGRGRGRRVRFAGGWLFWPCDGCAGAVLLPSVAAAVDFELLFDWKLLLSAVESRLSRSLGWPAAMDSPARRSAAGRTRHRARR